MNASRYFKLGLFVLTGTAVLFGMIVTLGAGSYFKKTLAAETYVDEPVTGLEVGSAVRYRGVPVGKVKQVRLVTSKYAAIEGPDVKLTRQILIELEIDLDAVPEFSEAALRKEVANGLRAKLVQSMITGAAYVALDFFDPSMFPPPAIPWKPAAVYVPSVTSTGTVFVNSVERLMGQLQEVDLAAVVQHFDELLTHTNRSLDELKLAELRGEAFAILNEVRAASTRVRQLLEDPGVDAAWRDLPKITSRLQSSLARVEEILHDKRLDQALAGLSDAATSAGPAAEDAKQLLRDVRVLVAAQQDDFRSIVTDLRTTAANLNAMSEDAKANPSRLLFERPPARRKPGE